MDWKRRRDGRPAHEVEWQMATQTEKHRQGSKTGINWGLDVALIGAFALLMEPDVSGLTLHEWGGLLLGAALLIHVVLHWPWVVAVTRRFLGHLAGVARAKYLVDAGIGLAFLTLSLTGIAISTTLNTAQALGLGAVFVTTMRDLHALAADLALILAGLHLALNWKWIVSTTRRFVLGSPTATPPHRVPPQGAIR